MLKVDEEIMSFDAKKRKRTYVNHKSRSEIRTRVACLVDALFDPGAVGVCIIQFVDNDQ